MIYTEFAGEQLSQLGFGAMRLPCAGGEVDEAAVFEMVDAAMAAGVNYFDTAYPYHAGMSEVVLGRALARHPRQMWKLATKYPGHQIAETYDPAAVFEEQLVKCGVDYFDYYLLHNVYENSIETYLDPQWGMVEYFVEQRRLGRIKHLGFSAHGALPMLERFLDAVGEQMEFCQIQLNWLDWTLQDAAAKVDLLNARGLPIWVMEPLRGGALCSLGAEAEARLRELRPAEGVPAWSFRFLQSVPGVKMILSGMSNLEQMCDNLRTFETNAPVNAEEREVLFQIAESMKNSVPCTACGYCLESCPLGLNIPHLLSVENELLFSVNMLATMRLDALPEGEKPADCLACGACAAMCPQGIDIPTWLADLAERCEKAPKWADASRAREEEARVLRERLLS